MLSKKAKTNFNLIGPKYGNKIKEVSTLIQNLDKEQIKKLETHGSIEINKDIEISIDDVEILSKDIAGYSVLTNNYFSVALDVSISQELRDEGMAREFVNRIQNLRKDKGYLVTDKIYIELEKNNEAEIAIKNNLTYICNETLTEGLEFNSKKLENYDELNLVDNIICRVLIYKK
jgi:isoleucyl-tRNA synthetase